MQEYHMVSFPKNSKLNEAILFGAGLTVGYILVSGGIKLLDKFTGGFIPDEFTQSRYANSYYGGETFNTLAPTGDGENYYI
jgi:hypothetical protein